MRIIFGLVIVASLGTVLYPVFVSNALTLPESGSGEIQLSPQYPKPNEQVTATVRTSGVAAENAVISWFINDAQVKKGAGETTLSFTTGSLGSATRLTAVVTSYSGEALSTTLTVRPARATLLWEGETYTPPFYRGRALYSSGSKVRLETRTDIRTTSGVRIPAENLIYTWKRNGKVIPSISGVGKASATVVGPLFLGADIFEVLVTSNDGVYAASSAVRITTTDPIVRVYEHDPLSGISYHKALGTTDTLLAVEQMQIQAVPYFVDAYTLASDQLEYTWRANGIQVFGASENPSVLTLQLSTAEAVTTTLELVVRHVTHILQSGRGLFTLSFDGNTRNSFFGF